MTDHWLGRPVADRLIAEATEAVAEGRARGWPPPRLVSLHRGEPTPYAFYLGRQARIAQAAGLEFEPRALPAGASAAELDRALRDLERDAAVHAVILEHPLPPPLDFHGALAALSPWKDVDGVGWTNLGRLAAGAPCQAPAVARAALALLDHYGRPPAGRRIAVVGRSATVGLPLAMLLLLRGAEGDATVTVAHSRTPDLSRALADAEIVVSCVGHPRLLGRSELPRGAVLVDVGLSAEPDPERPGASRAVGDADAGALEGWAGAITPVPGGVGPVTVAMLMSQVVRAWRAANAGERP